MKNTKSPKYRSRLLNLLAMTVLIWGAVAVSDLGELAPPVRLLVAYISWGVMIYFLMGLFFARKPSGTIAVLGMICAVGAELGRFDLTALTNIMGDMPIFTAVMMFISLLCYCFGILIGWVMETLVKEIWKRMRTQPVHVTRAVT